MFPGQHLLCSGFGPCSQDNTYSVVALVHDSNVLFEPGELLDSFEPFSDNLDFFTPASFGFPLAFGIDFLTIFSDLASEISMKYNQCIII